METATKLTADILAEYFDVYKLKYPVESLEFDLIFIKNKDLMKIDLENVNLFTVMPYGDNCGSMIHFPIYNTLRPYYARVVYYVSPYNYGLNDFQFHMASEDLYLPKKEYELLRSINIYKFLNQAFKIHLTPDDKMLRFKLK